MPIDKAVYDANLQLTQRYCSLQLNDRQNRPDASALRSFNPMYGSQPLFQYETIELSTKFLHANWQFDPIESKNIESFSQLYQQQLEHKRQYLINTSFEGPFIGRILIAHIDETLLDGASEDVSNGFIDMFDIPPIDSWFYLENNPKHLDRRILYAWIPEQFVEATQVAIDVNCVECFNWMEKLNSPDVHSNVIKSQNLFQRFGAFIKSRILGFKQF